MHKTFAAPGVSLPPKLFTYFPIPASLEVPAVGLDLSDRAIRVLELRRTRSGVRLGGFGSVELAGDLLIGGEIQSTEKLAEALRGVKERFGFEEVYSALPTEQIYSFRTQIPSLQERAENIYSLIEFKLEENVPMRPEEAIFDFEVIGVHREEEHVDVMVTAIPRTVVEAYTELFSLAGVTPLALESEAQSLARAVLPIGVTETVLAVDLGAEKTIAVIVADGVAQFSSVIDSGGSAFTVALQKKLGVSFEEAEKAKRQKGLTPGSENARVFETLVEAVGAIEQQVARHMAFWNSHEDVEGAPRRAVSSVVLSGGGANLIGLPEYLSRALKTHVMRAEVWGNTFAFSEYIPPIHYNDSLRYATAIGLALRAILPPHQEAQTP